MQQVVIENPILNSPYEEPKRHFRFEKDGITDEIVDARRVSSYFVPIAKPRKKKGGQTQLVLDTEWTDDRIEENKFINQVRSRVNLWREGHYPGITRTTASLLDYWTDPKRDRKLFFCQIEALETAIYVTEAAKGCGDGWIENAIREANDQYNPLLYRIAFKMATGSGKTVVMTMLIAWHTLNKLANPQDPRFCDAFLVVTPGITIRDRLRVLLPQVPGNYYRERDLLPSYHLPKLGQAKIVITNYHGFLPRERVQASKLTKRILTGGNGGAFTETPDQVVRRVCRELGNKRGIIVINDEAHHCYRRREATDEPKLDRDEREEAEKRNKAAQVWISGLQAAKKKLGIRTVYDLSATPFFLRGSGYGEGKLFPWVVSDFALIDAIESGIVKVPRVPVAEDSMTGDQPVYRDLWPLIRDRLPKKGRRTDAAVGEPKLPVELQGALVSLYGHYEKEYRRWADETGAQARGATAPVFIVVCQNTSISKLVFDYVAGWEKPIGDRMVVQAGALDIFRNDDGHGGWLHRPNTILVDSEQLESGEAMSAEFKKIALPEIEEFKHELRIRFPGRDVEQLTDEDLLREVMNTVGKRGKLGEHVKCVVSVSMLTEGWDASTVTHILGVRAFGTQLLCEQVVGRGLRRRSYHVEPDGKFRPDYADVFGVPFSFIPCSKIDGSPKPGPEVRRVHALEERIASEITFPRLLGYRYDIPDEELSYAFSKDSKITLSTADLPTRTENAPIVGAHTILNLDELKDRRPQEVAFKLAKLVLEKYFRQDGQQRKDRPPEHRFDAEVQTWRFPRVLEITRRWLDECVICKAKTFPQMLLLIEWAHDAADRIYQGIVRGKPGEKRLLPIPQPYETLGSTRGVDFDTTRDIYETKRKCHVNRVVADTESWEQKLAQAIEDDMEEVRAYVKNDHLGFAIPYTFGGEEHRYFPDFLVRIDDGHGPDDLLNLIVECSGEQLKQKAAKVAAARNLWVPAVNNHGGFGRWHFVEVTDPWDAENQIRGSLREGTVP
ncbi:MAG: DEAD/DEAH box helicase family protein [Thermoguttaceae bacterium]|jgi:type III restriction enzyme